MGKKTAILEKVLEITKAEVFTGKVEVAEKEAEAFANLYEQRDGILKRFEKVDARLQEIGLPQNPTKCFPERLAAITEKHKAIAAELLEMDKANIAAYENLKAHIQGNMKNVRQTIELNEKYILDDDETPGGILFDKKN
jgi:hypothetical protein